MNKRSFADENSFEIASKHPRHCANELVPVVDNVAPQKFFAGIIDRFPNPSLESSVSLSCFLDLVSKFLFF